MQTRQRVRIAIVIGGVVCFATTQVPAHAGILSRLRASISALWSRKAATHGAAQQARVRANNLQGQSVSLHDRLEQTQQALQRSTDTYYGYWHQMRRTEVQINKTRRRLKVATDHYYAHRAMFGRRLSAMQRCGKLGYLQLFLGSRTLSDLTRRAYLFNALTTRDAEMQAELHQDRDELQRTHVALMDEWNRRNRLQLAANRERERIARAERDQQRMLYAINHSRYATIAYIAAQEQSSHEIEGMIGELSAKRASIIQAYEEQAAARRRAYYSNNRGYHRYVRRRVARRVNTTRYVRSPAGELKPMPIQEIVYRDEMVPVDQGSGSLSQGFSQDNGGQGGGDGWGTPVQGHLSSRYGIRYHPILHRRKLHTGDDMAAPYGAPIRAAHGGRVLWAGWKKAYGNTVIVDAGNGLTTLYGHASKLGVKPGQPIKRGEYIGNVGSTGWSTGPHLHFEVRKNGKPIDPTPYLHEKP
ncbi:MAG: peptidoglycan DD-metalloendopeptidase family protein [Abitibacteriaceae bacterium]|nr:peptidoglycan DD-metalloendopeptidase family protein [Abditibacteriaceae bacterium]MBV9866105.1 peptidoglycan DD-metalloendopeptidase family protein [Abditibacteriaceae bacterium]